jgi:GNAT superfamily N-acetyltransferase
MSDHSPSPPLGYRVVPARTTYLEMLRNEVPDRPVAPAGCSVELWRRPPPDEYRALFLAVGGEWGWTDRLLLGEDELRALLDDPSVEIVRLSCGGRVAGFAELERQADGEVEIVYFGLAPEFIGRGLGGFLLRWTINRAWRSGDPDGGPGTPETRRLWLHTCEFDHPGAAAVYQKAGFRIYDEQIEMQPYPEAFLDGRQARPSTTRPRLTTEATRDEPSQ